MVNWKMWERFEYPFGDMLDAKRTAMIKYGDQDEKHLEEKIEDKKRREQAGEKVAEEGIPLEQLLEKTRKERIRED